MLLDLTIKNFKSFKEKTTIDFKATGYDILSDTNKTADNILKGALFVGSNASGKTTLIQSIKFLLDVLIGQINVDIFRCKSFYSNKNEKMELEYNFKINNSYINYKIETDNVKIIKEILIQDNREVLIRLNDNAQYVDASENKIELEKIENNQSALRKVYFDTRFIDNENLKLWYEFLKNTVYIDQSKKTILMGNLEKNNDSYFENDGKEKINKFLEDINYNQQVDYVTEYKNKTIGFNFQNKKEIVFIRKDMDFGMPVDFESEGNITLMQVLPQILQAVNNNCMIIIDEFSSAFHNMLEEKLIKYFMKNSNRSQIFIVSHSTNLLTNELLRPDQIYTVDYIEKKGSKVNRVSDSKPRAGQNLEKMYLSGVFNGIPDIK